MQRSVSTDLESMTTCSCFGLLQLSGDPALHVSRSFVWLLPHFPLKQISFICYSQLVPGQSHHRLLNNKTSLRFHAELITPCAGLSTLGWLGSYISWCPVILIPIKVMGHSSLRSVVLYWTLSSTQTSYTWSFARNINTVIVVIRQTIYYILSVYKRQHHRMT